MQPPRIEANALRNALLIGRDSSRRRNRTSQTGLNYPKDKMTVSPRDS